MEHHIGLRPERRHQQAWCLCLKEHSWHDAHERTAFVMRTCIFILVMMLGRKIVKSKGKGKSISRHKVERCQKTEHCLTPRRASQEHDVKRDVVDEHDQDEHAARINRDLPQECREFGAREAASVCPERHKRKPGAKAKTKWMAAFSR